MRKAPFKLNFWRIKPELWLKTKKKIITNRRCIIRKKMLLTVVSLYKNFSQLNLMLSIDNIHWCVWSVIDSLLNCKQSTSILSQWTIVHLIVLSQLASSYTFLYLLTQVLTIVIWSVYLLNCLMAWSNSSTSDGLMWLEYSLKFYFHWRIIIRS